MGKNISKRQIVNINRTPCGLVPIENGAEKAAGTAYYIDGILSNTQGFKRGYDMTLGDIPEIVRSIGSQCATGTESSVID